MLITSRKPTEPGKILKAHYLAPRKITITAFASAIDCSRKHISNIINGSARIEADLATRIASVLGTTPEFWLNLQNAVDVYQARKNNRNWKPAKTFFAEARV
jgi:antitoxin HigA-1